MPHNGLNWDRRWQPIHVQDPDFRPDFANGRFKSDWRSQIYVLPYRLLCETERKAVIEIEFNNAKARIYPPFPINISAAAQAEFNDVLIPVGEVSCERSIKRPLKHLSLSSDIGFSHVTGEWARAIRVDHVVGGKDIRFDEDNFLRLLRDHLAIQTWQWWLRGLRAPFPGQSRYQLYICDDYIYAMTTLPKPE